MMTDELNKKLNDWAGTNAVDYLSEDTGMSACFKWLVPKLLNERWKLRISWNAEIEKSRPQAHLVYVGKGYNKQNRPHIQSKADNAALALCLAIEKLIDGS